MGSEVIDIRRFTARDFLPVLDAEATVWRETLRWDFAPSARVISTCLNERRLVGYALLNRDRLRGYSFFFCEGDKGMIGNLFVLPDGDGLEDVRLLLRHVLETLVNTPGLHRIEAQLPHYTLEELEPCFRAHAFQSYRRRFMAVPLQRVAGSDPAAAGDAAPNPWVAEQFVIEPWERKHDRPAALLLFRAYQSHIDAMVNDQYTSVAGTTRLIENIIQNRGCGEHLPRASLVAIYRDSRKLAAALALTAVRSWTAHIPQIAVAYDFQNAGLGRALLETSMRDLARRGYEEVSLTVTDLNEGAVRLYARLGFETFRTFGAFVWSKSRTEESVGTTAP